MGRFIDITGQSYGRLLVLERVRLPDETGAHFLCQCECGNRIITRSLSLISGHTRSCGCLWRDMMSERTLRTAPGKAARAKEACKRYHAKPESKAKASAWYQATKAQRREVRRKYKRSPRGRAVNIAATHKRRARLATRLYPDAKEAILRISQAKRVVCFYCNKPIPKSELQIDHIKPLAKGGAHAAYNLVPACKRCNLHKNDKEPNEFIERGQQILVF